MLKEFDLNGQRFSLASLDLNVRNKVRSLIYGNLSEKDAVKTIEKLRKNSSAEELYKIESVIGSLLEEKCIIPQLFPVLPQTRNNYIRLKSLTLKKQLKKLDLFVAAKEDILIELGRNLKNLNEYIVNGNVHDADDLLGKMITRFGYSHLLLRKSVMISIVADQPSTLKNVSSVLDKKGDNYSNIISSLIHVFEGNQNILTVKRSMMSTRNYGDWNKYNRDILRLPFHPHVRNISELTSMLESMLQSSFIDALLFLKINSHLIDLNKYKSLEKVFNVLEEASPGIDNLALRYKKSDELEDGFYNHSSAWLEDKNIISYRVLLDHFYDSPEAPYFDLNDDYINSVVSSWVQLTELEALSDKRKEMTSHSFKNLKELEAKGKITRTSIFNYIFHKNKGEVKINESCLFDLMGITGNLDKTINIDYVRVCAGNTESDISKIILFLLISRKSRSEIDSFALRRILQKRVVEYHDSSLTNFVDELSKHSKTVAYYSYEVFNEDFISILPQIVKSATAITETRASLHRWMGTSTGDKRYLERERNLIIDNKIKIVRDEINDNRIYVDSSRFTEWMEDEVVQDLSTLLLLIQEQDELDANSQPQVFSIVEKCYNEFCSNKHFGVSSYIGRRIRHGTFKGNLYYDVISLENKYKFLMNDNNIAFPIWDEWKRIYEEKIDEIVNEKLHILTSQKKNGFLSPFIKSSVKMELAKSCMKDMSKNFNLEQDVNACLIVLTEYCWRFAEEDLKDLNAFLKNQKKFFLNLTLLDNVKSGNELQARDFTRELQNRISEKLQVISGWFKRPKSISPQVTIGLLFKAVVSEVSDTFSDFKVDSSENWADECIVGGSAYHTLYDALYVILFNAAKHADKGKIVGKKIDCENINEKEIILYLTIKSQNRSGSSDVEINKKLKESYNGDIDNAQLDESRSGIRKLLNLSKINLDFKLLNTESCNGIVEVKISYRIKYE